MPIPTVSKETILGRFPDDIRTRLEEMLMRPGVTGICYFECKQMDSSQYGAGQAMIFGPGCTFKTLGELDGKWLGDLPSQRQYPVDAYVIPARDMLTVPTVETPH